MSCHTIHTDKNKQDDLVHAKNTIPSNNELLPYSGLYIGALLASSQLGGVLIRLQVQGRPNTQMRSAMLAGNSST